MPRTVTDDDKGVQLLNAVLDAEREHETATAKARLARQDETAAENRLIQARKALVDHLAEHQPKLVDEIASRRSPRDDDS